MSSSFLAAKIAVCPIDRARRPLWGWLAGKNHPRSAAVFFPAKPCTIPAGSNLARKKQKYWLREPVMSNCIKDSKYENRSKPNEN